MAVTPLKAFLFAVGGSVAVAGAAYVSGALDPYINPPAEVAAPAPAAAPEASQPKTATGTESRVPAAQPGVGAMASAEPGVDAMKPAEPAAPGADANAEAAPAAQKDQPASPEAKPGSTVIAPTFDVVRVEGDGSIVIAGKAAPNARVAIIHGSTVLGETVADAGGSFAIALDDPLKPGDYQIVLRSTAPGNVVATSTQTAVVSVPEKSDGQVLALVEEPGKPSELITVPAPKGVPQTLPAADAKAAGQPSGEPAMAPQVPAGQAPAPAAQSVPAAPVVSTPVAGPKIVVEAVEIDGGKVFVAGLADPGRKVRAYANDILLGDAQASPDGHFLVEALRDLPVGDYIIHADALGTDGVKVVARAAVPFQREPGEAVAAVAPAVPGKQAAEAPSAPAPSAEQPSAVAAAQPEAPATALQPEAPAGEAATQSPDVPETVAPKLEHADGAVIIRRGDSLWRISRRVYGHGIRYSTIYLANQKQISDPDMIWPGQVFKVPETSKEGDPANLEAMGAQATTLPQGEGDTAPRAQ